MESIKLISHVGSDGILHLDVPVGITNKELEVMVIFNPLKSSLKVETPQGWMPGFFEEVIGGWAGEPLELYSNYQRRLRYKLLPKPPEKVPH
ncbi:MULTISPECIES: hypothetical protein [unclassified Moorena]|uniref:hypothetical protein n=1 Tax=unclassified Moorena TaxID=2683338 RepID=UPI0025E13BBD|nr:MULTISPECIES: hypothetical protein [unclassified Moorena]